MIATVLVAFAGVQADAASVLANIADAYRKLDSVSVTIEHNDSSGLFPGIYTQQLQWQKDKRFELKVTKPNPKSAPAPGSNAPDYYCDGATVRTLRKGSGDSSRPINTDPNTQPGYEVSGGLMLSMLLDSPTYRMILKPPAGIKIGLGPESTWKGEKVMQVSYQASGGDMSVTGSIYYKADPLQLCGMEYKAGSQSGWLRYVDEKRNAAMPSKLGIPPAVRR